jgi:hypothetical protein
MKRTAPIFRAPLTGVKLLEDPPWDVGEREALLLGAAAFQAFVAPRRCKGSSELDEKALNIMCRCHEAHRSLPNSKGEWSRRRRHRDRGDSSTVTVMPAGYGTSP